MVIRRRQIEFFSVVIVAFVLRAAFLLAVGPDPRYAITPDSGSYLAPARNIIHHGAFSNSESPPLVPEMGRTPGYSLFLAPFCAGNSPKIRKALWAQAALGAITAGLIYLTAILLWGNGAAALAAGLGLAVDFVTIVHTGFVLTETVFVFMFSISFLLLVKAMSAGPCVTHVWRMRSTLFSAGMCLGAASLVRPVGLYYFLLAGALLAWAWKRQKLPGWPAYVAIFLFASVLIPFGWMARNKGVVGKWTFSSIQGKNLYIVRAAVLNMHLTGTGYEETMAHLQKEVEKAYPQGFSSSAEEASKQGIWAMRFILSHPAAYSYVLARDVVRMLVGNSMKVAAWMVLKDDRHDPFQIPLHPKEGLLSQAWTLTCRHPGLGVSLVAYLLFLAFVYVLVVVGFVAAWRKYGPAKSILALSPVIYIFGVTIGAAAHARYRIPAMPAIFLLAGAGFEVFLRAGEKKKVENDESNR